MYDSLHYYRMQASTAKHLPRDDMLASKKGSKTVYAICRCYVCLSGRLSVTCRYCIDTHCIEGNVVPLETLVFFWYRSRRKSSEVTLNAKTPVRRGVVAKLEKPVSRAPKTISTLKFSYTLQNMAMVAVAAVVKFKGCHCHTPSKVSVDLYSAL